MRAAVAETGDRGEVVVGGEAEEAGAEDLMVVAAVATITGVIEEDLTEALTEDTTEAMAGVLLGAEEGGEAEGMLLILPAEAEATTVDITITEGDTETTSGPRILVITVLEDLAAAQ